MALNRVVLFGAFLAVAGAGACTTVRHLEPAALGADDGPRIVWVTRTNNTVVQVLDPTIKRDTLRGKLNGERVRIPLSDVQSVRAKVPDHRKTVLLVTALGVAAVSTVYVMGISQAGGGPSNGVVCGTNIRGDQLQYC